MRLDSVELREFLCNPDEISLLSAERDESSLSKSEECGSIPSEGKWTIVSDPASQSTRTQPDSVRWPVTLEEKNTVYRKALVACRSGRSADALKLLRGLVASGSNHPRHLSLYGVLLATAGHKRSEGMKYCERALLLGQDDAQNYLNLARVHKFSGHKGKAIYVLRKGLQVIGSHPGLQREIERLSPRRGPVLGSLHRDHVVNKYLGRVRARMAG